MKNMCILLYIFDEILIIIGHLNTRVDNDDDDDQGQLTTRVTEMEMKF